MHGASHFLKRLRTAAFAAFALVAINALADGPVDAGGVPGGAVAKTADNDALTGATAGEQWGRPGGRTITFTVGNTSGLGSLYWGVVNATVPTVAFDNSLTPNTSEYMTFDGSGSDLGGGIARWTGAAQLQLANGSTQMYPTRFTLTVTNTGGTPILLSGVNGSVSPGINVLVSGSFRANLLFEMQVNGTWGPLLTTYDGLPTNPGPLPGSPGPVLSGVSTGFYFTGAGITLAEHDAHIAGLLGGIKGDTEFLRIDMVGRLTGLSSDVSDIKNGVQYNIPQSLQQILNAVQASGGQNPNLATRDDVNGVKDNVQQLLFTLFGLMPCPSSPPDAAAMCNSIKKIKDLSTQSSVDALQVLIGMLNGKVDATQAGINGLGGKIDTAQAGINGLGGKIDAAQASVNALGGKVDATQGSVNALGGKVDAVQGGITSVQQKLDALQAGLHTCADLASLDVQASPLDAKGKTQHWLLRTTQDGLGVNPQLSKVLVIRSAKTGTTATDATSLAKVVTFTPGLHDVSLDSVKSAADANAIMFEVRLTDGSCTLVGSALVSNPASKED